MLIKKLQVFEYRVQQQNSIAELNNIASANHCPDTSPTVLKTIGFIKPFLYQDPTTGHVESIESYGVAMIQIQQKKARRSDVSHQLTAYTAQQQKEGKKLTHKERQEKRKEIEAELTRNAVPADTHIICIFDINNSWLWVGTSNKKELAEVKTFITNLGIDLLENAFSVSIEQDLTHLIKNPNQLKQDFELGKKASLQSPDKSIARYSGQDLCSKEIDENVDKQKDATALEMSYKNALSFCLVSSQAITGIKYDIDECVNMLEIDREDAKDDELHRLKQYLSIQIGSIAHMLPNLYGMFRSLHGTDDFSIQSNN